MPGDLRTAVCRIAGWYADATTWEKLHVLARGATSTEEQNRYYQAFEEVRDPALARRTLALALSEERGLAQWFNLVAHVARRHPELAWNFARENSAALLAKVPAGGAFLTRNTYFPAIAENFSDETRADELLALVSAKVGAAGASEAAKSAENIRFKAELRARVMPAVDAWIAAKSSR